MTGIEPATILVAVVAVVGGGWAIHILATNRIDRLNREMTDRIDGWLKWGTDEFKAVRKEIEDSRHKVVGDITPKVASIDKELGEVDKRVVRLERNGVRQ